MTEYDDIIDEMNKRKIGSERFVDTSVIDEKLASIESSKKLDSRALKDFERDLESLNVEEIDTTALDEEIIRKVHGKDKRLNRKERKMIKNMEQDNSKSRVSLVLGFAVIGIMFIMGLQYVVHEDWALMIIVVLGSMLFMPFGMIMGWALLDPYMRCKILRKTTKRNFGIINFVGKGQKIVSKIKNFDQAIIWKKNEAWVITKEHVYQITKDGDRIVEKAKIDPESIVTLIDTVPVLYVDIDSMQPLSLARDRREGINPLELGSTLKAWVDNQMAKGMFIKNTMNMFFAVLIICAVITLGLVYMNMSKTDDILLQIKVIQNQLTNLTAVP